MMPQPPMDSFVSQILNKYQFPDRAKRDALNALKFYKNLSPKLEAFVFNDGSRKELMCLDGTVPVSYKGVTYNIPICLWLLDSHPFHSPMCFVKPTPDMEIKVSRHVDNSGRIYLPYLHEWNPNSSDMLGLIQIMIVVFGETPPVYSKPKNQPESAIPCAGNPYSPPRPPGFPQQTAMPVQGYNPYPNAAVSTPYGPQVSNNVSYYPQYPPSSSFGNRATTPYPAYPPNSGVGVGVVGPTSGTFASPFAYLSNPVTTNASMSKAGQQQGIPTPGQPLNNTGTISEEYIRASLLSAVEDKLKQRFKETVAQTQAEMEVLRKTQDDLTGGKSKLESMCHQLEWEQTQLENSIRILREKNEEMQDLLTKLEGQESVEIDEVVTTTAPLYKQLLNAFSEESATEDAIYYLGEALRKGVIDLDVFLKNVRELSRKQFMLRALMQKCRQKAGLPF